MSVGFTTRPARSSFNDRRGGGLNRPDVQYCTVRGAAGHLSNKRHRPNRSASTQARLIAPPLGCNGRLVDTHCAGVLPFIPNDGQGFGESPVGGPYLVGRGGPQWGG
jgi:hypothetical protein